MTRVNTHLMFQRGQAAEALALYESVFPGFKVGVVRKYADDAGPHAGWIQIALVSFDGHDLIIIDSPVEHAFDFTPSVSLFVEFDDVTSLDAAFARLADGGEVKMPLDDYGFSDRFGWATDRFGMSWQLNCGTKT